MEKLNIAELLKNCPTGMELDCTMFEDMHFDHISDCGKFIYCYINYEDRKTSISFNKYGAYCNLDKSKCVIFPKGKTTWEGFQRPFKDGDIIYNKFIQAVAIFCKQTDEGTISHCFLNRFKELKIKHYHSKFLTDWKLATEEEKQKLFDAIEMNGYKWNAETKTLEKLPEFKDGDIIFAQYYDLKYVSIVKQIDRSSNIHVYCLYGFTDSVFAIDEILGSLKESLQIRFATEIEKQKLFQSIKDNGYKWNSKNKTLEKLSEPRFKVGNKIKCKSLNIFNPIEIASVTPRIYTFTNGSFQYVEIIDKDYELVSVKPKFKVGDKIKHKDTILTIIDVQTNNYIVEDEPDHFGILMFSQQDMWELMSNKFDINTLKPFDKVLVRDHNNECWMTGIYSHQDINIFIASGHWKQCIPYKGNEYLLGKTDVCNDYYKTWE